MELEKEGLFSGPSDAFFVYLLLILDRSAKARWLDVGLGLQVGYKQADQTLGYQHGKSWGPQT